MNYQHAKFRAAYGAANQLPASVRPEIAFAGRSNVGKSSLLNKLFNHKGLAKTSQTPGKTATVNFFEVDDVDFVDLPGYGYAKVAKSELERWSTLINSYLEQGRRLALVCVLVDIRHDVSVLDKNMVAYLEECGLPYLIVFTKGDKLSKAAGNRQAAALAKQLELKDKRYVLTSSEKGLGIDDLKREINAALKA